MATVLENLLIRRAAVSEEISLLDEVDGNGKPKNPGGLPDVKSSDGGVTTQHYQHKMGLYKELSEINKLIQDEIAVNNALSSGAGDPYEFQTVIWPE